VGKPPIIIGGGENKRQEAVAVQRVACDRNNVSVAFPRGLESALSVGNAATQCGEQCVKC